MPIRIDRVGEHVVTVTLEQVARHNALGEPELRGLAAAWATLAADRSVRAVTVRGAGDAAFSSGADLSVGLTALPDIDELIDAALLKTRFFPKPLVAAITGTCLAGGLELALSCDIRVVAADARLGLPEVRWGILPSGGAAMKLADAIGASDAMRLLLSGESIDGTTAAAMGFGSLAADARAAHAEALRLAQVIAQASPVAVQATKRAACEARCRAYASREAEERRLADEVRASGHLRIGLEAFRARRAARYPD
jgi:E-phenylitaconyl-CoA hydratase